MPTPPALPSVSARPSLAGYLARSNPFYLISAGCMLGGCLALTNSLSWWGIPTTRLLILFATLNLYEATLIGLAAYLVLVRGLRRDGLVLAIVEIFFLVDITFINAEISTHHSWIGPTVAALSFAAAIVKVMLILRILGVRRALPQFVVIVTEIAVILALPLAFARNGSGWVSPLSFYFAWWAVGLMPAVYELLVKTLGDEDSGAKLPPALVACMALPWLSMAAHLGILHYVYNVDFSGPMLAPVLIGLALLLNYALPRDLLVRRDVVILRVLLPLAAIFFSLSSPGELTVYLDRSGHLTLTTLRIATILAYLEFMYAFLRPYWIFSTLAGVLAALAVVYGPTADQMGEAFHGFWYWLTPVVMDVIPTTQTGWGVLAVVAAFVFLALGATVSLTKKVE
jgi:hypothetical protein